MDTKNKYNSQIDLANTTFLSYYKMIDKLPNTMWDIFRITNFQRTKYNYTFLVLRITAMQQELMQGMSQMHQDMMAAAQYKDPDVAFAAGMLPHHIGAVKMAEVELKYGKDPEMRKLAENIINAQQAEIEQMQKWLKVHNKK